MVTPLFVPAIPALEALGIGRTTAYKLLNEGKIPAVKMLGKTMVRPDDLTKFVDGLRPYIAKKGRPTKRSEDRAPWDDDDAGTSLEHVRGRTDSPPVNWPPAEEIFQPAKIVQLNF